MFFSLIVATLGRDKEVQRLLDSLKSQTYKGFEVILVDQNRDKRIGDIIDSFSRKDISKIKHIKTNKRGAARARNLGIAEAEGDVFVFPDDDCWYAEDLLEKVKGLLDEHTEWEGISGMVVGPDGKESVGRWDKKEGWITKYNQWVRHSEVTLFIRASVFDDVQGFDPLLGVGAGTVWGSGESADLLLKILEKGYRIYYTPEIKIYHPLTVNAKEIETYTPDVKDRNYRYAMGMGHILKKHRYPLWYMIYQLFRPFAGVILSLIQFEKDKASYYFSGFIGRLNGIIKTKASPKRG